MSRASDTRGALAPEPAPLMRTEYDSGASAMARGAAVNIAATIAAAAFGLLFNFVITHVVSVGAIGLLALGTTVVSLATVPALFGLDTGAIRFVALGASADDERAARGAAQVALLVVTTLSVALAIAIWWKAPWLGGHVFHKPKGVHLLRIVCLALPGLALGRVLVAVIQGFGVMTYSAWLAPLRIVINLLVALPLLAVGLGVRGLAIAAVVTAYGTCLLGVYFLTRVHPRILVPAGGARPFFRMLSFSAPQTLTATMFFAILWTDTLLLARFRSAAEVGVYTIVGRLLNPSTLAATAIGQMFAPRIVVREARRDRKTLATMLKRVTYWNTAVSLPLFLLLVVLSTPLLVVFGARYSAGANALAILAAGQLLNTAAGPLGQVINLSGRPYLTMLNNALVAGLNVVGCLLLIPRYGMTGAACSTAGSLTLVNLIKLGEVKLIFRMSPFRRDSVRAFAAGAVAVALAVPVVFIPSWPSSLAEIVAGAAVLLSSYVVLFWLFALNEEEHELVVAAKSRLGRALGGVAI
jgi:O-antigen/teichoic acid export membrane protein